jgi:predicted outer membrane repeat protein
MNSSDDILISGGGLTGNVATGISGATASGGEPAGCTGLGGGIYESDGTNLAGAIVQNNGAVCGGGVFADQAPLITSGGRFINNHATYQGGAIRSTDSCVAYTCTHGYLILTNPFITLNRADGATGGVYTDNPGDLVVQGSPLGIQANIAPGFCKNANNPCF